MVLFRGRSGGGGRVPWFLGYDGPQHKQSPHILKGQTLGWDHMPPSSITGRSSHEELSPVGQARNKKIQVIIFGQEIQPSYVVKWHSSMAVITVYLDHALQFNGVSSKLADAVWKFLHGHAVLIVLPTKGLLIQVNLVQITVLGCIQRETTRDYTSGTLVTSLWKL